MSGPLEALVGLESLLAREAAALSAGEMHRMPDIVAEKRALAARLEAMEPALRAAMAAAGADGDRARAAAERVGPLLDESARSVGALAAASRQLAAELSRIAGRPEPVGGYDGRGARRGMGQDGGVLDRSV